MKTPKTDAAEIEACHVDDDGGGWIKAVPSIIARDFEIQIAILEHEKSVLCDFINRELKMTGNDPRIAELEKRMAAMPNADISGGGKGS